MITRSSVNLQEKARGEIHFRLNNGLVMSLGGVDLKDVIDAICKLLK